MHPQSLAEEEVKTEQEVVEGMDVTTRSKGPAVAYPEGLPPEHADGQQSNPGSAERPGQKRKLPSPQHSSNGHSPQDASASPSKKKKKPGMLNSHNKDQSELRHGPFYYMKQPLTTDPVDVVPQDGRNDFYCWVCHREGQVLCCELCPRVYHAKCLKLNAEPEGDWFCPECEKITVAECIETQSKAMTMLTIEQLSYLLKFALQKMKQPGTEPFQKPVSLEQHPDYAEYIFNPMDLSTLEKNVKKKMYGCTEAFLAEAKWILHNCIIYNGGNHKLTQTAKVIIKICEHEMNEIEVCPECYLAACQKRENWFCEPCSNPHPLVWAKLKGFPFWPAKALRDKDGQVDARFFGQHDRAWVPMNNCYLMSKEIPFSVKKTKSIFNSAMQEMEVYVENIRKRFGVFNYAPFRTPYTPNNQYQMLLDTSNPGAGTAKTDKQEKIKLNFDMTASPKILMSKPMLNSGGGRRISLTDMPRSPMSTNSSVHTGSDVEQDADKKAASSHFSASEESMDFIDRSTASPVSTKMGHGGSITDSPKPFSPQSSTPLPSKPDRSGSTGSILNLNLDRSKAEMDLKELSESVLQQSAPTSLISPKRQIRSRFQLNLDKTIESCKAQLGINEIPEDAYAAAEHSDSEESEKTDSSDSEYVSDEEKPKNERDEEDKESVKAEKAVSPLPLLKKKVKPASATEAKDGGKSTSAVPEKGEVAGKEKPAPAAEKDAPDKGKTHSAKDKLKGKDDTDSPTVRLGLDSDSESELVIDLGEDHSGREGRKSKKEAKEPPAKHPESKASTNSSGQPAAETPIMTRSAAQAAPAVGVTVTTNAVASATTQAAATGSPVKKQRPLLPKETVPTVQRVVWNPSSKFQTSSQKWHMQKVQRQQHQQQQTTTTPTTPTTATTTTTQPSTPAPPQSPQGTRYQTRQAVKAVQQKEVTMTTTTSTITLVTSAPPLAMVTTPGQSQSLSSSITSDLPIATASADVAADIAKYTSKMMDAIKGTMTEIYNDLSKNTAGSTIAEIRRLRIEIEKLQWLHQQELSEMKHNLELTMAEMRQSLEQERDRLIAEVKKQTELEKQQAVDETKKKQWCANCKKEAIFYCCWNTSYCDYPCQQAHWPEHMKSCTQSATVTQQEAEPELDKSAQSTASAQPPPTEPASTPKEKESTTDKSKESVTIATGVTSSQPIKLVHVPQTTAFIPTTQPTITIPVVGSPNGGAVAARAGVQYVQTTVPVQVRRV
ncbi:PREDICTED: protein kinase C-binding protein 1 isoform X2 [Nanorana parkeri]|uniref:protein kinase C-binding protein 1 isoform X2 n=1 Tax=Nanorana parkeri TaxID=125878 RepID=UPI0008543E56|nr:PREDICTED: protein kinase C-binding protein 1 isoform X2 [Nanorana parkeri]